MRLEDIHTNHKTQPRAKSHAATGSLSGEWTDRQRSGHPDQKTSRRKLYRDDTGHVYVLPPSPNLGRLFTFFLSLHCCAVRPL